VSRAKTAEAESIEMSFGVWPRNPRNHVLGGGPDLPRKGAILGDILWHGMSHPRSIDSTLFIRGKTMRPLATVNVTTCY